MAHSESEATEFVKVQQQTSAYAAHFSVSKHEVVSWAIIPPRGGA
jgi:hypothetical protein